MRTLIRFGEFTLDPGSYLLRRGNRTVDLEPRTFELLAYLVRNRHRVVPKQELLDTLWRGEAVGDAVLFVRIGTLRRALGDDRHRQETIRTVHRRGYQFVAPVASAEPVPAPPPGLVLPFVGRTRELAMFEADLAGVLGGQGRASFLSGEPGIGKTRLASEFAAIARKRGVLVRVGRGSELPGAPAFLPWAQILHAESEELEPEALRALAGASESELAQVAPTVFGRPGSLARRALRSPEARFSLFDAVTRFVRRATSRHPRLLVLDDLHRADLASLHLLQFLASELSEMRLLLVGIYRPTELESDETRSACIAAATRRASARSTALTGLTREDVQRLQTAVPEAAGVDAYELHAVTSGNPFFVTQLLSLGNGGGGLRGAVRDRRLPRNLDDAIAQQLSGCSADERELLSLASVLGREFETVEICAVSRRAAVEVESALDRALRAGIVIREGSRFRFAHILVRDCLYRQLPARKRIELHAEAAVALERLYVGEIEQILPKLAHHFCMAAPVLGSAAGISYATRAADAASSAFAYDEAAGHVCLALRAQQLETKAEPRQRCDLLILLATSLASADRRGAARDAALRAARIARELGDRQRLARAALSIHPSFQANWMPPDAEIAALHVEALERLGGEGDLELRGQLSARLAIEYAWPMSHERRVTLSRQAVEASRHAGDLRTLAAATISRFVRARDPGEDGQGLVEQAAELIARAQAEESQETELTFRSLRAHLLMDAGDVVGFDRELLEFAARAHALRNPFFECYVLMAGATRALMQGRLDAAEAPIQASGHLAIQLGDNRVRMAYVGQMGTLLTERGQIDQAREQLDIRDPFLDLTPTWLAYRSWAHLRHGELDEAKELFERMAYRDFERVVPDLNWLPCHTAAAEVCARLGDTRRAGFLYERLLPHADGLALISFCAHVFGCPSRQLGMLASTLGDLELAERHLLRALERDRRLGANVAAICDRMELARTYRARRAPGDRARADELAVEARSDALARGLLLLAEEAADLPHP